MVAVSGGKDSYTLLHVLMRLRERAPIDFDLVAVNLDQGQPGYPADVVEGHLRAVGVPYRMIARDTYSVVRRLVPEGKDDLLRLLAAAPRACSTARPSRWAARRSPSATTATTSSRRCSCRALYSGALKSMPAKLLAKDGRNVVVRPLCYAAEEDIAAFAAAMRFPIVPCDLCGSQPNLRRRRVKALLAELGAEHPAVKGNLLHALAHVVPVAPPRPRPPPRRRRRRPARTPGSTPTTTRTAARQEAMW